ncbi:DUF58 domain-containing protein [Veronia pacifica]|uniref:Cytosolic protein n=1 Tax=Veronia pacifica TaxID=1080227 RepID=A0A1C3EMJ5_9GAMM|nr:DUF58 domain-containing protein [Veronia pacifica]ODA34467.1 cytosolic protein [Veronia pacifica]
MTLKADLPLHADGVNLTLEELLAYKNQAVHWSTPSKSLWSSMAGQHKSATIGRGMDFNEVRLYQPGDDIRAIDWRVTARTGKPHTKLFSEERERPVMLLLDNSGSMHFGSTLLLKSVQAAHFASLVAWIAAREKDRVGMVVYNGHKLRDCRPTARQEGPLRAMHTMITSHYESLHQTAGKLIMSVAIKQLHYLCPKGSDIVVISDFYALTPSSQSLLSELRKHNQIFFVHVSDPLEQGYTSFQGVENITDDKRTTRVDFSSSKPRHALQHQYNTHIKYLTEYTRKLSIPLYQISASKSLQRHLDQLEPISYGRR